MEIVFNGVGYNPDDEEQSWLEQYGLIKEQAEKAQMANDIYEKRFLNAFFQESDTSTDITYKGYYTPDGFLDMETILSDFEEYITQIGVNAFYSGGKPYEKTGQFLLTAWLYQFVERGKGDLRYEPYTGLGRMDSLIIYRSHKYIIEMKINRSNIDKTIARAVEQVCGKYLLTEKAKEGYGVVFDTQKKAGDPWSPPKAGSKRKGYPGIQHWDWPIRMGLEI